MPKHVFRNPSLSYKPTLTPILPFR
jgi:hypothetical protein